MAWNAFHYNAPAFPTPMPGQNIYYPPGYAAHHGTPFDLLRTNHRHDSADHGPGVLQDRNLERCGDLGWTLDYATAWLYRHLVGSQPNVIEAIDEVRELCPAPNQWTPFYIFDYLDHKIFDRKLHQMVYLYWSSRASCITGTTYTPRACGIPRIAIELNATPFMEQYADFEDLLDALIHQMIHAFFLVCCGTQKKSEKPDGRLMDGIHFGVILMTIRDISKHCRRGQVRLIFHAMKRQDLDSGGPSSSPTLTSYGAIVPRAMAKQTFIAVHPQGGMVGPAPVDGQTHCLHDNRKIRPEQIHNWQVAEYSKALDLGLEAKGDKIWDWDKSGLLVELDRVKVEPSSTFAELIWEEKRVMVPRKKALEFPSIVKPLKKHNLYELEMPRCDLDTFSCIFDFINKPGHYRLRDPADALMNNADAVRNAPEAPILVHEHEGERVLEIHMKKNAPIMVHLKVFHAAEEIKFEELMQYALRRLYQEPLMTEDPIVALKALYKVHPDQTNHKSGPINAELHRWARKFLTREDDMFGTGISNIDKLLLWDYQQEFKDLYHKCAAFQDDVKIAGTIRYAGGEVDPCDPASSTIGRRQLGGGAGVLALGGQEMAMMRPQALGAQQRLALMPGIGQGGNGLPLAHHPGQMLFAPGIRAPIGVGFGGLAI